MLIFDMDRRGAVHVLPIVGDPLGLSFSPDGNRLAVANAVDPELTVWDLQTGKVSRTLTHRSQSSVVDFHPDGKHLVTGGDFGLAVRSGRRAGCRKVIVVYCGETPFCLGAFCRESRRSNRTATSSRCPPAPSTLAMPVRLAVCCSGRGE